jgi:hypothetical protein
MQVAETLERFDLDSPPQRLLLRFDMYRFPDSTDRCAGDCSARRSCAGRDGLGLCQGNRRATLGSDDFVIAGQGLDC